MPRRPSLPPPVIEAIRAIDGAARPEHATVLGEGWGSVAFQVPAAGGDYVLRLPREGVPWAVDDLEREVRFLPLLTGRPFETGVPREARLVTDGAGRTLAALHRMVPGVSSRGVPLRGAARRRHLADIGRFLSVLHATPHAPARRHGVEARNVWLEVSRPRIEETMALAGPATRAWLTSVVRRFETLGDPASPPRVLVHGDLSGDHLLVGPDGRLAGVIDFAEARLSDPAFDFAGVLNRFSWRDLAVVLDHYEGAIDATCMERVRVYIEIAPIYSVTDGFVALGEAERRRGLRRLAARAARG